MEIKKVHAVERHIIKDGQTIARAIQAGNGPTWIILDLSGAFVKEVAKEDQILADYGTVLAGPRVIDN